MLATYNKRKGSILGGNSLSNVQSSIREQNTYLVLTEIVNNPEISRAQISSQTSLNKATVSEIVKKLIEEKYVIETGIGESSSTGGRKPILLKINKKAGISISFDIRYDRLSYMITYLNGEIITTESKYFEITKDNVVSIIEKIVSDYRATMEDIPFGVIGIGIALHGIVSENKILFTPYYDLDQIDLAGVLQERLNVMVHIENEANLSALAESTFNSKYSHLISCSIHTGIGAGIIINQNLYRGYEGRSGEVGHTVLYPHGKECPCGNKGCFEQYCSERALIKYFQEIYQDTSLTFKDLVNYYKDRDEKTINIISTYSENLSIGLSNLMGTYGPEAVYINSEVIREIPEILDLVREHLNQTIYKRIPLYPSSLAKHASLYGATVLNIQNFLQLQSLEFSLDMKKVISAN